MKVIKTMLVAMAILSMNGAAYAAPAPKACPSVEKLKTIVFNEAQYTVSGYVAYQRGIYGTEQMWGFGLGPFLRAQSPQEAIESAQKVLATLSGQPKPHLIQNVWACVYGVEGFYVAGAVTPPDLFSSFVTLMHHD
ncbi:MAG: DUF4949 domain-containing protein [Gammaproteobacteria bacterium]|nr:DUF4949 domain-containing protein [Gammaproteobacteria bacterium]